MKIPQITLFLSVLFSLPLFAQSKMNVSLFGQYHRGDARYSGSWVYIDFEKRQEYALLGTRTGTAIYSIDNQPIKEVGFIAGPPSNWREITVLGQYAYVTTEGAGEGEGMQIIDLSTLPDSISLVNTYTETFTRGHIIQRDMYSNDPFVYVMGTCTSCGVNILDVSEPTNPIEVGTYSPGYYIHDAHIRGDFLYAAAFYEGLVDIVDISNKENPVLVAQIEYAGGNTHSGWTTEDKKHLIISGEKDGLPARIWNIEDLSNLYEVANYSGNLESLTHNPYVRGKFVFFSHNTEGLRVVDIQDPSLPVEVGFYDTFEGTSGGFNGLWSACPYLPSGKIIGGNREDGLYVWTFNNARAGRFYATVKDESTKETINNVNFYIHKKEVSVVADLDGVYKFGSLPGIFKVEISAEGYESKVMEVRIEPDDSLRLDIALKPTSVGLFDIVQHLPTLEVSPNPFNEFTVLDLANFEKAAYLRVFNAFGQLVRSEEVIGGQYYILDRESIESGTHIFTIFDRDNKMLANKKVIAN